MTRLSKKARKYWVVAGGVVLLVAMNRLQIEIPGLSDVVRDMLIAVATMEGVYRVRNDG